MISVRLATLADTGAIVDIYRSHKPGMLADLTLYERWQEGGPWMSIETGAVHLNRLLAGSGVPLVAEVDGRVFAEAEVYESFEPPPYGHHLHIGTLVTHVDHEPNELEAALIKYIAEMARLMKCERITATGAEPRDFYDAQGFRHTRTGHSVRFPSQPGRVFYQSTELTEHQADQVKGWYMPLGRYQSSRQEWDKLFPQDWAAGIPELLNIATAHVKLTVTGQNAIMILRESDQPGEINVACWSARPLSQPLLTAIRDRAPRDGYQTIVSYVLETTLPANDIQVTNYTQEFYELPV